MLATRIRLGRCSRCPKRKDGGGETFPRLLMEYLHTDPNSGLSYYTSEEPVSGKTIVRTQQDCQAVIDHAAVQRAEGMRDKGIDGHMKKYCDLPMAIILELKKKGINMLRPSNGDWKRFFQEIETNYPLLKTTEMKGWRPK